MSPREEILLKILQVDAPAMVAPEIILEGDGNIGLSWNGYVDVSIAPSGNIAWAIYKGGHGSDLNAFIEALKAYYSVR